MLVAEGHEEVIVQCYDHLRHYKKDIFSKGKVFHLKTFICFELFRNTSCYDLYNSGTFSKRRDW